MQSTVFEHESSLQIGRDVRLRDFGRKGVHHLCAALLALALTTSGCSSLGGSGPSAGKIAKSRKATAGNANIQVINLDDGVARRSIAANRSRSFSEALGNVAPVGSVLGPGDVMQISIWEAPPAVLFGASVATGSNAATSISTGVTSTLPEQMVNSSGQIRVPYIGTVQASGLTINQVEMEIARRLDGIAHNPQVVARLVKNATANVTVIGDTANSARVPLTPKGERLLDVLAAVGGTRQPVSKTTVQITRANVVATMPLQQVAQDPSQNIVMNADDVVNVMFQPYSFTALGAVSNNAEIPFEGTGLTLAQALGRIGGLRDERADIHGVFVFRLEDPTALPPELVDTAPRTLDGKVPVIYRLDLGKPASFFLAQSFPVLNHDVIYVSNAPGVDLQRFVGIISSMAFSVVGIKNGI